MARREYEMSEAQKDALLQACKPVPYMVFGGAEPRSPQQNANDAWERLGRELGFKHMTVEPVQGKGVRFFTAEPADAGEGEG